MQLCDVSLVSSWVFQCVCVCVRVSPDCTHPTHLHGPPSSSYILLCSLLQLSDCRGVPFSVRVVAPVPIPHVSLVTSDLSSFLHRSWLESGFFCPFVYCLWWPVKNHLFFNFISSPVPVSALGSQPSLEPWQAAQWRRCVHNALAPGRRSTNHDWGFEYQHHWEESVCHCFCPSLSSSCFHKEDWLDVDGRGLRGSVRRDTRRKINGESVRGKINREMQNLR